jgi:8-oxo-dGTP pyrophosphatase MutT (NUDIX family)
MPELAPPGLTDTAEDWPVIASEDLYRGPAPFAVRSDTLHRPGDGPDASFSRIVVEHPGAAVILAVDDQDRVLVVVQYRHPARQRFVELPAGLLDKPGEDPEEAARRELVEETGYQAESWTHLGSTWSSPGVTAERIHLYLARGLSEADRGDFVAEHEEADMGLYWLPLADLEAGVLSGQIADAPVVTAVLLARAKRLL